MDEKKKREMKEETRGRRKLMGASDGRRKEDMRGIRGDKRGMCAGRTKNHHQAKSVSTKKERRGRTQDARRI